MKKFNVKLLFLQLFTLTITLAKKYSTVLDGIYKREVLTFEMEAPEWLRKEGATAKSVLLPKVTVTGMKNYSRTSGYLTGDNTFEWEEHTYAIDRGIEFSVDRADNMESIDTAFAYLAQEFMRTAMVPEVDAYRFATLAGRATAGATVGANLTASTALQAWDTALTYYGDAEVPKSKLLAYVSYEFYEYVKQAGLVTRQFVVNAGMQAINREVDMLDEVMIKPIPRGRFYTQVTLQTGNDAGYIKTATTGRDINFLLTDSAAALADKKIDKLKIFDPDTNQDADAWKFQYRLYHDIFTPDNKLPGIYLHHKTT